MLTCYITNNVFIIDNKFQVFNYYLVLSIPIVIMVISVYLMASLVYFNCTHYNKVLNLLLVKYLGYSIIYILFYVPQLILHFVTIREEKADRTDSLRDFIYVILFY